MTERKNKGGEAMDVAYVARQARMALTPEETAQFQRQLEDVLAYVGNSRN